MSVYKQYAFWFITGSQHLYGADTLAKVREHSAAIVAGLNTSGCLPAVLVDKALVTTPEEISAVMKEANHDDTCAGVITWMHTFSPSKMWIAGLSILNKPYLHLHPQFTRPIPNEGIDMDFMNLNQSAPGDREHGFIGARLRLPRKIIAGYWDTEAVKSRIGGWMRTAVGVAESRKLKVCRFGDNMREVAVTEGDKVEAQLKLGWTVNTYAVGDLVEYVNAVTEAEIETLMAEYGQAYTIKTGDLDAVCYQARLEAGIGRFLKGGGFGAFTDTFEDLHGLRQLPGLATQRLLAKGYGFGGEGDWKTAALTRVMKVMAEGLPGGTAFMEDYTYDFGDRESLILGAHMLEVCPSLAATKPTVEVHPLGIGGKEPPARLVFEGQSGPAICASLVDMGGRMRLIVNDVAAVKPISDMPNLPVARVMWKPLPSLEEASEAWILAGGAHHTVMSFALTAEHLRDFATIMGIEFVHIGKDTTLTELSRDLTLADIAWKLK